MKLAETNLAIESPYIQSDSYSVSSEPFFVRELEGASISVDWKYWLKNEAADLFFDCSQQGWDGYNAQPISNESVNCVHHLIDILPRNIGFPDLVPEPSGEIGLQWRKGNEKMIVIKLARRRIIFSVILASDEKYSGQKQFIGQIPVHLEKILSIHFPQ